MLQNKLLFNQSSVSLEIIGLPDQSKSESKDKISIISNWRLMIIGQPLIEGNIDHLNLIMAAFYSYSNFLINNEKTYYESKLIDIKAENFFTHNILLKSSKPDVKPLKIKIGNSVLADIINCFDQFDSSDKVRKVNLNTFKNNPQKSYLKIFSKKKITNFLLPPLISLCSLSLVSLTFIYFYNNGRNNENNAFLNSKLIVNGIQSRQAIL